MAGVTRASALPALRTARLDLTPVRRADVDALHALWTRPEVRRFLWDDREIARAEAAAVVEDCLRLAPDGLGLWTLRGRADGELVGCAGLLPVAAAAESDPRLAGLVEPVVALRPEAWGRGLAAEALAALQRHAVDALGLARLAGATDVPNAASDRMLRRAGFRALGECDGPRWPLRTYLWDAR